MRSNRRAGFTLVELMVAMALTLFVMVILTQAFATSLDTFSGMKGIGDMQQNLRTAGNIIRNDLSQNHLDGDRRLSDLNSLGASLLTTSPNQSGYLAILQETQLGSATYIYEGADANGVPSYRAVDHVLYMSVRRRGNRLDSFFSTALQGAPADLTAFFGQQTAYDLDPAAQLPFATLAPPYVSGAGAGFYASQWAEVVYFLVQTGSTEEPLNPASQIGTPVFGLYRAQFVMVPNGTNVNTLFTAANKYSAAMQTTLCWGTFAGMSTNPSATTNGLQFFSPDDAAQGNRVIPNLTPAAFKTLLGGDARFTVSDASGATLQYTSNLVLPNVLSFHLQVLRQDLTQNINDATFTDVPEYTGQTYSLFDTAQFNATTYPNYPAGARTALKGIQVTLRVFDPASRQSRQMTIVQDL